MIFFEKPEGFESDFNAVGTFVEDGAGYILQLLRGRTAKIEPGKFGTPGGKSERNETQVEAAVRELLEETGLLVFPKQLRRVCTLYVDYGTAKFTYTIFSLMYSFRPEVKISHEHVANIWIKPSDAFLLPLMKDEGECIEIVYGLTSGEAV